MPEQPVIAAGQPFSGWPQIKIKLKRSAGCVTGSDIMANPFEFIQEVRAEIAKVTWPTQKETVVTTIMVLILVAMAMVFFFAADQILNLLVQLLIGAGQS